MISNVENRGKPRVRSLTQMKENRELRGSRREHVVNQIDGTRLVNALQASAFAHQTGKDEDRMDATQTAQAKILLDRIVAPLQAIEVTHINEDDKLSEAQIKAQLYALIAARPELIDMFNAHVSNATKVIDAEVVDVNKQKET